MSEKYPCPCCEYLTYDASPPGTDEMCPVCGWEDDEVQFKNPFSGEWSKWSQPWSGKIQFFKNWCNFRKFVAWGEKTLRRWNSIIIGMGKFRIGDILQWKKVTEPVINNYVKDLTSKGHSESEVKGWISFLRERIDFWTAKQLDYRIKSPTGPDEMRP